MKKIELENNYFVLKGHSLYQEIVKKIIKEGGGKVERSITEKTNCVIVEELFSSKGKEYLNLRAEQKRVITYLPFLHCAGVNVEKTLKYIGRLKDSDYKYYLAKYYLYYSEFDDVYKENKINKYVLDEEEILIKEIAGSDKYEALSKMIKIKKYDVDLMINKGFVEGNVSNQLILVLDYWKCLMENAGAKECLKVLDDCMLNFDDDSKDYLSEWKINNSKYSKPLAAVINHMFKNGQHGIYLKVK